jgi:hypothetical protein
VRGLTVAVLGLTFKAGTNDMNEAPAVPLITALEDWGEWEAFAALDLPRLGAAMRRPVMVDLRNLFAAETAERAGFAYTGIGRGAPAGAVMAPPVRPATATATAPPSAAHAAAEANGAGSARPRGLHGWPA